MIRKKTLRKFTPLARKMGGLVNEMQSTARRLKNLMSSVQVTENVTIKAMSVPDKKGGRKKGKGRRAMDL